MSSSMALQKGAAWPTTSGITGLILHGMMDDPDCTAGRLISASSARGPKDGKRRSLQILESLTATRLSTPDRWRNAPSGLCSSRVLRVRGPC